MPVWQHYKESILVTTSNCSFNAFYKANYGYRCRLVRSLFFRLFFFFLNDNYFSFMRKTVYDTRIDFQISMPAYYMLGNSYIGLCENHRWSTYDHIAGRTFSNCSRSFTTLLLSAASVKSRIVTTVTPPKKKAKPISLKLWIYTESFSLFSQVT